MSHLIAISYPALSAAIAVRDRLADLKRQNHGSVARTAVLRGRRGGDAPGPAA
ncbi:hypothetical protein [Nonomuraea sp. NPDC049646]|uniref:hypothetical protein n=1 Tax=unclassified Nonomuraea TaxID=2593643 RepID=UPI0037A9DF72